MSNITIQVPHYIAVEDNGFVRCETFIDIVMLVIKSPMSHVGLSAVEKIVSLSNHEGDLTIVLSSELTEHTAHELIKIWNLLEPGGEVEMTVDTRG